MQTICFLYLTNTVIMAKSMFFTFIQLGHSKLLLATQKSSMATFQTGNELQPEPLRYSSSRTSWKQKNVLTAILIFHVSKELMPTAIDNKTEEEITIHRYTTFRFPELSQKFH